MITFNLLFYIHYTDNSYSKTSILSNLSSLIELNNSKYLNSLERLTQFKIVFLSETLLFGFKPRTECEMLSVLESGVFGKCLDTETTSFAGSLWHGDN